MMPLYLSIFCSVELKLVSLRSMFTVVSVQVDFLPICSLQSIILHGCSNIFYLDVRVLAWSSPCHFTFIARIRPSKKQLKLH